MDDGWFSVAGWNFGWLEKYLIELGRANPSGIARGRAHSGEIKVSLLTGGLHYGKSGEMRWMVRDTILHLQGFLRCCARGRARSGD